MAKTKMVKAYVVRVFTPGHAYSVPLGRKLRSLRRARKLVSWLKARGHEAFTAPMMVNLTPAQVAALNGAL